MHRRWTGSNWLVKSWLPVVLLITVYGASWAFREFFQELTIAPFLSLVSLFLLASRRSPLFVFLWTFPFLVLSYILIAPFSQFVWTRLGTLLLGGWITTYVAHLRARAERLSQSHQLIFSTLPYPVLVSDSTSKVVFFNQAASDVLKIPPAELAGFSWFNLLYDDGAKSADIERYVRLSLASEKVRGEPFRLCGIDGKIWNAEVVKDSVGEAGRLITTFSKNFQPSS